MMTITPWHFWWIVILVFLMGIIFGAIIGIIIEGRRKDNMDADEIAEWYRRHG